MFVLVDDVGVVDVEAERDYAVVQNAVARWQEVEIDELSQRPDGPFDHVDLFALLIDLVDNLVPFGAVQEAKREKEDNDTDGREDDLTQQDLLHDHRRAVLQSFRFLDNRSFSVVVVVVVAIVTVEPQVPVVTDDAESETRGGELERSFGIPARLVLTYYLEHLLNDVTKAAKKHGYRDVSRQQVFGEQVMFGLPHTWHQLVQRLENALFKAQPKEQDAS